MPAKKSVPKKEQPSKKETPVSSKPVKVEPTQPIKEQQQVQVNEVDTEDYSSLLANLVQIEKLVKVAMPLVKRLQKKHEKDLKMAEKSKKKKRARDPNAQPSGFARPGPVSAELRGFLGMKDDELIARTQVAKKISEYINEKGLKNPDNQKEIVLDKKLSKLFKVDEGTKVEFFKIQSFLTSHFVKANA